MKIHMGVKMTWMVGCVLTCVALVYYTFSYKGEMLDEEYEMHAQQYKQLQAESLSLSTEIYMLNVEIESLKKDSEESSLAARTLLGMVRPSEFVYQLNTIRSSE